jgi:hypothetical protein
MQLRGTFPALYDNIDKYVTALLGKNVQEIQPKHPRVFPKVTFDSKFKRWVTSAPFGDVPEKPEGNPYATDIIQQAYTKDVTPREWGLMFEVSETAEEDDQYDELAKKSKYLVFAMRRVEDKQAANVLNNGFTTQLTADGVALFSTAHTLKRGGTAKNRPSTDADLSYTGLVQAFIDLATDTKLESGQLADPPTEYVLVVPPHSEMLAHRLVNAVGLPQSADNDPNPLKDRRRITVMVWPDLSDTDSWFLIPVDKDRNGLIYAERLPITQPPMDRDPQTGNKLYKLRCRKTWDSIDWRNCWATVGA